MDVVSRKVYGLCLLKTCILHCFCLLINSVPFSPHEPRQCLELRRQHQRTPWREDPTEWQPRAWLSKYHVESFPSRVVYTAAPHACASHSPNRSARSPTVPSLTMPHLISFVTLNDCFVQFQQVTYTKTNTSNRACCSKLKTCLPVARPPDEKHCTPLEQPAYTTERCKTCPVHGPRWRQRRWAPPLQLLAFLAPELAALSNHIRRCHPISHVLRNLKLRLLSSGYTFHYRTLRKTNHTFIT